MEDRRADVAGSPFKLVVVGQGRARPVFLRLVGSQGTAVQGDAANEPDAVDGDRPVGGVASSGSGVGPTRPSV